MTTNRISSPSGFGASAHSGFTLVELLVAGLILVIVTTIAGAFLIRSYDLSNRTQARNDVQVNTRTALQVLSTDLFNSGSSGVETVCASRPTNPLNVDETDALAHQLTVRYCELYTSDTGRPAGTVTVTFNVAEGVSGPEDTALLRNDVPVVGGVIGLHVGFTCVNGTCGPGDAEFPDDVVSATIEIAASSTRRVRDANDSSRFDGTVFAGLSTSNDRYYEYARQVVRLPNLRR